ncbi:hypothetical protein AOLI_G00039060 [Acnodon oligacanthus]
MLTLKHPLKLHSHPQPTSQQTQDFLHVGVGHIYNALTVKGPTKTTKSTAVVNGLTTPNILGTVSSPVTSALTPAESCTVINLVPPQSLPFVPFALVTVIFLHIIVAVVYHTKRNKGPSRVHCSTADVDGVVSLE